ncbi:CLUMA_CG005057, isoform A [Clunio marinus]|uniref:CLUMA_CG005057, isoform A n=1 Tax=Clunio marinus TaxID=568069 RepID=A0A1J1HTI6_9DIPT|nr:CLUMA_CG005057, isoform A [Clunio marinus]
MLSILTTRSSFYKYLKSLLIKNTDLFFKQTNFVEESKRNKFETLIEIFPSSFQENLLTISFTCSSFTFEICGAGEYVRPNLRLDKAKSDTEK